MAPTPTPAPAVTAPATLTPAPAWRADSTPGGRVGEVAPNATVMLTDGTPATLARLADGKPLLLYFFATW